MKSQSLCILLAAFSFAGSAQAQAAGIGTPKVDVHTHLYPQFYHDAVVEVGWVPGPDGNDAPPVSSYLTF